MPPSSTNVIEDDDISSSAISELDSNRFTYSGGDDVSSDSIPQPAGVHLADGPCGTPESKLRVWSQSLGRIDLIG